MKKKNILIISVVFIALIITGFVLAQQNNFDSEFDKFVTSMHKKIYDSDDIALYTTYLDKVGAGFKDNSIGKPVVLTEEKFNKRIEVYEQLLQKLENDFDYNKLNKEHKYDYDVIKNNLQRELLYKEHYLYYVTYCSSPYYEQLLYLLMYGHIKTKEDFNEFCDLYADAINDFDTMYDILKLQLDNKVIVTKNITDFMSIYNVTEIRALYKEQVNSFDEFTSDERNEYIDKFDNALREVDFVKKYQEKEHKIQELHNEYNNLPETLDNRSLIASTQNGKDFYSALVKYNYGLNIDVDSFKALLVNKANDVKNQLDELCEKNGIPLSFKTSTNQITYTNLNSNKDVMDYFYQNYNKYFPKCTNINYKIKISNFDQSAIAYYITTYIDTPNEEQLMGFRQELVQELYPTIAHEGIPGHMYQYSYHYYRDIPEVRKLMRNTSNTEGWASYIEKFIINNFDVIDKEQAMIAKLARDYKMLQRTICDIGINYEGWNYNDFINYYITIVPEDDINTYMIFYQMLQKPNRYAQYCIYGLELYELYYSTKEKLQDKFDAVEYHKVILDCSFANLDVIKKHIEQYINENLQ